MVTPCAYRVRASHPRLASRIVTTKADLTIICSPNNPTGCTINQRDLEMLLRNTEVIAAFTDAFDAAGIPYVVNRGRGFYESRAVNDLVHLLRVIANPEDEVSMAVVLRSPLVGASDEDLLRLKSAGGNLGAAVMQCEEASPIGRFRDRLLNCEFPDY